jgi:undecaprenyl-diphosphatase
MPDLEAIDQGALLFFENHRSPVLDSVLGFLTNFGSTYVLIGVTAVAALLLALRGRWRSAVVVVGAALLAQGLCEGVKRVVNRPRPKPPWEHRVPDPYSFPSGHSLNSMAVYGAVALAASRGVRGRGRRALLLGGAFFLSFVIGVTRLYLCVHHVSDVLGGWAGGLACALLAHWVDLRWDKPRVAGPAFHGPPAGGEVRQPPTA